MLRRSQGEIDNTNIQTHITMETNTTITEKIHLNLLYTNNTPKYVVLTFVSFCLFKDLLVFIA